MAPILKWSQTATSVTVAIQNIIPAFDGDKRLTFGDSSLILYDSVEAIKINASGIEPSVTLQKKDPKYWTKLTEFPTDFIIRVDWNKWSFDDDDDANGSYTNPGFDLNLGEEDLDEGRDGVDEEENVDDDDDEENVNGVDEEENVDDDDEEGCQDVVVDEKGVVVEERLDNEKVDEEGKEK